MSQMVVVAARSGHSVAKGLDLHLGGTTALTRRISSKPNKSSCCSCARARVAVDAIQNTNGSIVCAPCARGRWCDPNSERFDRRLTDDRNRAAWRWSAAALKRRVACDSNREAHTHPPILIFDRLGCPFPRGTWRSRLPKQWAAPAPPRLLSSSDRDHRNVPAYMLPSSKPVTGFGTALDRHQHVPTT